jgi:hypothetical protein
LKPQGGIQAAGVSGTGVFSPIGRVVSAVAAVLLSV